MMFFLENLTYAHPDKDLLFDHIHLSLGERAKIALVGNNGTGKSTLLKIMAGILEPSAGTVVAGTKPYYVPQLFDSYSDATIAQALGAAEKLDALNEILSGNTDEVYFTLLDDDWTIAERCAEALAYWRLDLPDLSRKTGTLSGGQKVKVFLAGIAVQQPEIVLLDEPSNHLDADSRHVLYEYIRSFNRTLVVVSHDRTLLHLLPEVYELSPKGITVYGGNYAFYEVQKEAERNALQEELKHKEKTLRKAKETEREAMERQQKQDARGRKKQDKAGLPTISLNTFRNNAEKSTARMKDVHAGKVDGIANELEQLRKELPAKDKMKIAFDDAALHTGKILVQGERVLYDYGQGLLWPQALDFVITSGSRIALRGANGSGKTTFIKLVLGKLEPTAGSIRRAAMKTVYVDQDYSLIDGHLTVYGQVQQFNTGHLQEHEIKSRLTHFLFTQETWNKSCAVLSGGEKMRLMLCCLTVDSLPPDMIILDEPTNNLDIQNIEILTSAINEYRGTLLVVSHDAYFLQESGVNDVLELAAGKA